MIEVIIGFVCGFVVCFALLKFTNNKKSNRVSKPPTTGGIGAAWEKPIKR